MARPTTPDAKQSHARALDEFKASASYFATQREREVSDLKFIDFDEQWTPQVKSQREGGQSVNGLPQTPPRPTLTINQLLAPVAQVASQRRAARLALEFAAKGGSANDDIAEAFEDLARAIQAESGATTARNWAADRSEKAGLGWYRIDTEYALENPEEDDPAWNDQNIVYRRILNQASVYPDKDAQEADFSDGRRLFITQDLPEAEYRALYPTSDLASTDNEELTAVGDERPDWVFTAEGGSANVGKTIRIAECWEVVEGRRKRVGLTSGGSVFEDELTDEQEVDATKDARYVTTRKVLWSKINAIEYLEGPQEWNGAWIPVIPTIWKEANVGGERRWTGIVRPGKEAAVSYNVIRSAVHETIALATKAPYIGYFKSIQKFLSWWNNSNTRNFPMLPLDEAYDKAGNLLPPPKRNVEEPAIQALMSAAQAAKSDIESTTGIPSVALGDVDPSNQSGEAIKALQSRAETGASGGLDNLVSISLPYEAKVLRDLIPRIYDRPGRLVPAIADDETRRLVLLNLPYTEGPDGRPVPVPSWREGMPIPPGAKYINFSQGEYSVQGTVGKDFPTRQKQASDAISRIMETVPPEMAAALAPAMIEDLGTPGARKLAAIAKQALPPPLQAAYDDGQTPVPPEVQAKLQESGQMIQTLTAHVNDLTQQIQTKQVEAAADYQQAQLDAQTKIRVAEIQAAASMSNAQAKVDAENFRSYVDALEQRIAKDENFRFTLAKAITDHAAKTGQQASAQAHAAGIAAMTHAHDLAAQAQQAALAPPPAPPSQNPDGSSQPLDTGDDSAQNGGQP